ncbi:MAG TPA: MFS transporter [Rubrivivax sp.]|nr:MFS transporter [Rubrivivax sp.]
MHHPVEARPQRNASAEDDALFSKINWRLLPLLTICYLIAFLDRVNIGFAQLQMKQTLAFSDAAFAFGAGVFFLGYFLFEVPSNLMLEKIGARKTLLRIMFCWGIVASAMMFVQTPTQFYILRFLLGAFEAGFYPGIVLYFTFWYPAARRGRAIAIFMTGATIAVLIAGPFSGAILKYMNGWLGLHGWQWMFVVQGLPASILGIIAFFYLKDKPEQANWLTPAEKAALRNHIDNDPQAVAAAAHGSLWALLRDPKVYTLALAFFMFLGATYVMVFWTPTLIRSWGISDLFRIGLLSSIAPLVALAAMVLIGRSSDRHMERRWHFLLCACLVAVGAFVVTRSLGNLPASLAGLALVSMGQSSATPLFFAACSDYLPKKTAAGGIALISSLGNLGPFVMPSVSTWINTTTGAPVMSLYLMIALWLGAALILIAVVRPAAAGGRQLAAA